MSNKHSKTRESLRGLLDAVMELGSTNPALSETPEYKDLSTKPNLTAGDGLVAAKAIINNTLESLKADSLRESIAREEIKRQLDSLDLDSMTRFQSDEIDRLKKAVESNDDISKIITDMSKVVSSSSRTIIDMQKKTFGSGKVDGDGFADGVNHIKKADVDIAARQLCAELKTMFRHAISYYPESKSLISIGREINRLGENTVEFHKTMDLVCELNRAVTTLSGSSMAEEQSQLIKMSKDIQSLAGAMTDSDASIGTKSGELLNQFDNKISSRISSFEEASLNASSISSLRGEISDHISDLRSLMLEYKAEHKSQINSKNEALDMQQREITDLKNSLDKSVHDAMTDHLTKIPNRRQFDIEVGSLHGKWKLNEKNSYLCAGMIDIDFFKKVNDTYGHAAGDRVLIQIAEILKEIKGGYNQMAISRLGGEEFAFAILSNNPQKSIAISREILMRIRNTDFVIDDAGTTIKCTISIGVSFCWGNEGVKSALKAADATLYSAKEMGRDRAMASNGEALKYWKANQSPARTVKTA